MDLVLLKSLIYSAILNPQEKDIIRTYLQIAYKNSYTSGDWPGPAALVALHTSRFGTDYLNEGNKYVISLDAHFSLLITKN
jgi:hypothetical protein